MVTPGKLDGHIAANHRAKCTALRKHPHVNVDHEQANGQQRAGCMDDHGDETQPTELPGYVLGKPQDNATEQKQHATDHETPEEQFLPRVVAACRGHLLILVADIVLHRVKPSTVDVVEVHL